MKKVLFIIAAILMIAITSCEPQTQRKTTTDDGASLYVRRFESEGHQYIEFKHSQTFSYDDYTGYVHDPDCPCQKQK